jgi:hypothetical protein
MALIVSSITDFAAAEADINKQLIASVSGMSDVQMSAFSQNLSKLMDIVNESAQDAIVYLNSGATLGEEAKTAVAVATRDIEALKDDKDKKEKELAEREKLLAKASDDITKIEGEYLSLELDEKPELEPVMEKTRQIKALAQSNKEALTALIDAIDSQLALLKTKKDAAIAFENSPSSATKSAYKAATDAEERLDYQRTFRTKKQQIDDNDAQIKVLEEEVKKIRDEIGSKKRSAEEKAKKDSADAEEKAKKTADEAKAKAKKDSADAEDKAKKDAGKELDDKIKEYTTQTKTVKGLISSYERLADKKDTFMKQIGDDLVKITPIETSPAMTEDISSLPESRKANITKARDDVINDLSGVRAAIETYKATYPDPKIILDKVKLLKEKLKILNELISLYGKKKTDSTISTLEKERELDSKNLAIDGDSSIKDDISASLKEITSKKEKLDTSLKELNRLRPIDLKSLIGSFKLPFISGEKPPGSDDDQFRGRSGPTGGKTYRRHHGKRTTYRRSK